MTDAVTASEEIDTTRRRACRSEASHQRGARPIPYGAEYPKALASPRKDEEPMLVPLVRVGVKFIDGIQAEGTAPDSYLRE